MSGTTIDNFVQCENTNSTYMACPSAAKENETSWEMTVAIHNPSSLDLNTARIAVPNGDNYTAKHFNEETMAFEDVKSSLACNSDFDLLNHTIYSCFLTIAQPTLAYDISLMTIQGHASSTNKSRPLVTGDSILLSGLQVTFEGYSVEDSVIKVKVYDETSKKFETLSVSLKWWASFIDYNMWDGA